MNIAKTSTYFLIVSGYHFTEDGILILDSWFSERFATIESAKDWFSKDIRNTGKLFFVEQIIKTSVLINSPVS